MPALFVFVDYDNVEPHLTCAGPVNLAKLIFPLVPATVLNRHNSVTIRLYGGWRHRGGLTVAAQQLIPDIRKNSPTVMSHIQTGQTVQTKIDVVLADSPIGWPSPLAETHIKDRGLRKFRARQNNLSTCVEPASCGLRQYFHVSDSTPCGNPKCSSLLGDLLVRDEQKMVDTLLVADIAHVTLTQGASDIVVVSSDNDMWPGVLLALRGGCMVTHIHTKAGRKTATHLLQTLGTTLLQGYQQLSA